MKKQLRKKSEVWQAVDDQRIALDMPKNQWKRSYEGICAALRHVGLDMVTTKEELAAIPVPKGHTGDNNMLRKIVVSRDGRVSVPTALEALLSGKCSLLTDAERKDIANNASQALVALRPKGVAICNDSESKAVDDLDELLQTCDHMQREHLDECRLADIAYCALDEKESAVYVSDQVKAALTDEQGRLHFHDKGGSLMVSGMIRILEARMSLTCIGKTVDDSVDVVWFFEGLDDISSLKAFKSTQGFSPQLHLKNKSFNLFTTFINQPEYRFDVGASETERARLVQRKLLFARTGTKHTLLFLNEDDSQIPCKEHRVELLSMQVTRTACASVGAVVERCHANSYGKVDFNVNPATFNAKIQDKSGKKDFRMRRHGKHPYNPDHMDVLQVTDIDKKIVYAMAMRVLQTDGTVSSYFSEAELFAEVVSFGVGWREAHSHFRYDMQTEAGAKSYVAACEAASRVPQLTDRAFYDNMIRDNADKFKTKRELKKMPTTTA